MSKKKLKHKITLALALGTLLSAGQALAAEENVFPLEQITVTADRTVQTVGGTANNVTVITAAQLEEKGARTLADALFGVSGVVVQDRGASQKGRIKIFGSEEVVIMVDGKRMNLPQGISMNGAGVDVNTILLGNNIERIEVVRGGGSVLYGADAVGGVINIITKKGADSTRTTTSIAGGNYGAAYYSFASGGRERNTHWYVSGVQDSNDGQRVNSAYKGKTVSLRLDQELDKDESLTFTYDYYGKHAGVPGSVTAPKLYNYGDILRHNWSAAYTKTHSAGSRIFRYYDNEQVYSGYEAPSIFRHENIVRAFEYQDSAKIDNTNLLTWGGEWRKDKVVSSTLGDRTSITKAIYVQDQYSFNSLTKLTLGMRRDDNTIWRARWLPKAALLHQANANTSYFANWGKVFRAPNFDELYANVPGMGVGDPNLKPENGWTAEVGVKTKLSGTSEATLSFFRRDLTDAITWIAGYAKNINQYTANGLNAGFTVKLSKVTTGDVGYTYLDSRKQDNTSVGEPMHTFEVGITINHGKLTQRICGVFEDASGMGSSRVSGHFAVNSNMTYAFTKDLSFFLTINNALNKEYQTIKNYLADGRTVILGIKQTW